MLVHGVVLSLEKLPRKHRGVAPVIATILLVAIAVVGGIIMLVLSQAYFNDTQISGTPSIEAIVIFGYDARDVPALTAHDGMIMALDTAGDPTSVGKSADERVAVYIKNNGVNQVHLSEIRLGGTVYDYDASTDPLGAWDDATNLVAGEYSVLTDSASILQEQAALLNPGQSVTILIDLEDGFPINRDAQFKLTTINKTFFVDTIIMGHNKG